MSASGHLSITIRAQLRRATHAAHRRLDDGLACIDLGRRAGYCAFLAASAAALMPLETRIEADGVLSLLPDWAARARSQALLADLAGFGVQAHSGPLAAGAFGAAELFGIAYVLEGSRLGAALLVRQVRESADAQVRTHSRYLAHGEGERLWPSFLARLETAPDVRRDPQRAIDGALFAFSAFEAAFEGLRDGNFGTALNGS